MQEELANGDKTHNYLEFLTREHYIDEGEVDKLKKLDDGYKALAETVCGLLDEYNKNTQLAQNQTKREQVSGKDALEEPKQVGPTDEQLARREREREKERALLEEKERADKEYRIWIIESRRYKHRCARRFKRINRCTGK